MPMPKRRKGESLEEWRSRIIALETRAGKPPKQAQAIGCIRLELEGKTLGGTT